MQRNAEPIKLYGNNADERTRKKSLENIEGGIFDIRSAALIFDCHVEDGNDNACDKQRPSEERKQMDGGLHPFEVEYLRAHVAHHRKEVSNRAVYGFVKPFHHRVPYRIGDLLTYPAEGVCYGIGDPVYQILKPIKHFVLPPFSAGGEPPAA